jgi:hypothetical protein
VAAIAKFDYEFYPLFRRKVRIRFIRLFEASENTDNLIHMLIIAVRLLL